MKRLGRRTLCLPFLRWLHRFSRPDGLRYPNFWEERIRNYIIGHRENGLDEAPIREHFSSIIEKENVDALFDYLANFDPHS